MLDINYIREHTAEVRKNLARRKNNIYLALLDKLLKIDEEWRKLKGECDNLRARRNKISAEINALKKQGKDASKVIREAAEIPKLLAEKEQKGAEYEKEIRGCLLQIPNLMHSSVPNGKDETENVVVRTWGKKPKFKFPLKSHVDLIIENDWADIERATKLAGNRWYFLKGELAILEMALTRYAIDFMQKKGYVLLVPPFMMSRKPYEGVVNLGTFEEALYKIEGEDLHLIATSEHPITAQYMDEVLDASKLPLKFVGFSTNFRKEAGAHGKDQKGIFRVHQFNKVEQVIFCKPEDSWKLHEELMKNAIDFWKTLELPFHQLALCSGDMGTVMAKTYDLEVWMPVQDAYREIVSCSTALDYQARRLNIKYQDKGEKAFVHTLNSTCVATSRALVAILENFQNKDGSVNIPKVLHKYTGFKKMGIKKGRRAK